MGGVVKNLSKKNVDKGGQLCYNYIIKRGKEKTMRSDAIVGMWYPEAIRFIEVNDLWAEVVDIKADAHGMVTAVIH